MHIMMCIIDSSMQVSIFIVSILFIMIIINNIIIIIIIISPSSKHPLFHSFAHSSQVTRRETLKRVIVRTLDLVTIVIPPALPAAMTVGVVMAQKRLWNWLIYCINSNNINLCGAVDCFCFDKTGTLTEDGLDLRGVVPIVNGG